MIAVGTAPNHSAGAEPRRRAVRAMRGAWVAIAAVTIARIVYQGWLSPYELVADEAQYWDWSRRLALSYYSKGPGIAWLIALSTCLFGVAEWSIRLPAAVAFAVTAAAVARFAVDLSADERTARRAAVIGAVLVTLIPAYQLAAILMTIDAPYIACWAIATWFAWRVYRNEVDGRPSWLPWLACAIAVGAGFLFKYTMLLLVPGLMIFAVRERRAAWRGAMVRALSACAVVAAFVLPVLWWNVTHEAAGLSHLLGYLAVSGGDRPVRAVSYDPAWTATWPVAQLAVLGPVAGVIAIALQRGRLARPVPVRFAVCCAAPMLMFFLAVTLRTRGEVNWPIAAYVSLLPLAAITIAESPRRVGRWWAAAIGYGVVALLAIHAPLATASLPGVGRYVPTMRFRGFAARAGEMSVPIQDVIQRSQDRAMIVATSHNAAGLLAFYLPGRPAVASAGRFFGDRRSAYDYFDDVSLTSELNQHRPAVLVGGMSLTWHSAFALDDLTMISRVGPVYVTTRFNGPRDGVPSPVR